MEMIAFINGIAEIGGLTALTFIILFFFAVREGYNFCVWVKEILDKYHAKQNKTENVEEQFETLKKMNEKEDEEIALLRKQFEAFKKDQEHCKSISNDYHIAIIRNTLYHIYNRCKKYGYIDQAGFEAFEDLKKFYLEYGGNSIFKHKVIPYIESLSVKGIEFENPNLEEDDDI